MQSGWLKDCLRYSGIFPTRFAMKHVVAAVLFAFAALPAWAVNKCVGANGAVAYQEQPCERGGEKLNIQANGPAPEPTSASILAGAMEHAAEIKKMRSALANDCGPKADMLPVVGMREADFLCTRIGIFNVKNINVTTTLGGESKQYVIAPEVRAARYVYTENGMITAVQR